MQRGAIFDRLDRFKREGKIRFYGVSLENTSDGLVAIQTGKPDTLQVVYNIFHQDPEEELFPLAQKDHIGILARVPLERGVLSGRFQYKANLRRKIGVKDCFLRRSWRKPTPPWTSSGFLSKAMCRILRRRAPFHPEQSCRFNRDSWNSYGPTG